MTYENEFIVNIEYKEQELTVSGTCEWSIENDSFDYAGTHCTHGQSGTHELPDYCVAESCDIDHIDDDNGNDFPISDPNIITTIKDLTLVALQVEEDDEGYQMKHILELAEDAEVDAQLANQENRDNY